MSRPPAGSEPVRPAVEDLGQLVLDAHTLDELAAGRPTAGTDDLAAVLLTALRADVMATAARLGPAGADAEPAGDVIALRRRRRRRWSGRAVAAGAVVGVVMSGSGVAAALTATPGDLLYGVRRAVIGPVDDPWHQDAERLLVRTRALVGTASTPPPAQRAQVTTMLVSAARLVPGIRDPGRRRQAATQIQAWRSQLGLPSSPIPTVAPPVGDLALLPLAAPTGVAPSSDAPTASVSLAAGVVVPSSAVSDGIPSLSETPSATALPASDSDDDDADASPSRSATTPQSPKPSDAGRRSHRPSKRPSASASSSVKASGKPSAKPSESKVPSPGTGQQPRQSSQVQTLSPTDSAAVSATPSTSPSTTAG